MVYIYNKLSLNEDSPPPNSQRLPTGASTYTRISSTNQTPKRMGRRQFQQSSPGFSMAAMSFVAHFQPPHQFPPVTCAPPFPPSVSLASAQGPPGDYAYRQEPASMYKPHQPPLVDMPFQLLPPTRFGFPQGLPQQQTMAPPVEFMPPEVIFGVQAQLVPAPMYVPESNVMPFNGTVPPPGFESNTAFNTQNASYQYNSNNYPAPPVVNSPFSEQISPDSPYFLNIPMQPFPLFIPSQKLPNQRRPKAIAIIDPATGMDKLNEIYGAPTSEFCETDNGSVSSQ